MKKTIKIATIFVAIIIFIFLLNSCSYVLIDKIGKLGSECSEMGIGTILPKNESGYYSYERFEDFNKIYQSLDSKGYYFERMGIFGSKEQLIVIFKYDEVTYKMAKEYSISNMRYISNTPVFSYFGYEIFDTLWHEFRDESMFSQHFAYNDKKCEMVFFGSYFSGIYKSNAKLKNEDFEKYISLFSKYYDFTK